MSNVNDRPQRAKKHAKSKEKGGAPGAPKARGGPAQSLERVSRKIAAETPGRVPGQPLPMRCDGAILISVEHFGSKSIEGREIWTGVVLDDREAGIVRKRTENYAQETAARLAGGTVD